jgi:hypothetical protein
VNIHNQNSFMRRAPWPGRGIRASLRTGNARREYRSGGGQLAGPGATAFHNLIAEIRGHRTTWCGAS